MVACALAGGVTVSAAVTPQHAATGAHGACSSGYVAAIVGGEPKCLHAGEFCSTAHEADYERYGFTCTAAGHLEQKTGSKPKPSGYALGRTLMLGRRSQTAHCTRGTLPDRQCSPGAYYSGLTKAVICSSTFRTSAVRNVSETEKHDVELEYGMAAKAYGRTIEIDHIVPLEIGGSNDISNLFPEPGTGPDNYHVKDRLENRLHTLVCSGVMTLAAARQGIATNWELLYKKLFAG